MEDKERIKLTNVIDAKKFFNSTDEQTELIQFTMSSLYEASTYEQASKTARIIGNYMGTSDLTITESSAGIGANTNAFAEEFKEVNAVELDITTMDCLMTNMRTMDRSNVNLILGNYLERFDKLSQDVVFIDPPWMGMQYKNKRQITLEYKLNKSYVLMHELAKKQHNVLLIPTCLRIGIHNLISLRGRQPIAI